MDWSQSLRLISFTRACKTIRCNCWGIYQSNALRPPWTAQASANCPVLKPKQVRGVHETRCWEFKQYCYPEGINTEPQKWELNQTNPPDSHSLQVSNSLIGGGCWTPAVWSAVNLQQTVEMHYDFQAAVACLWEVINRQPNTCGVSCVNSHHWNFSWNSMFGP